MVLASIEQIALRLRELRSRRKWWRRWARHSAVALCLRAGAEGPELLMIQRAEREGDRWSGHMGFPGGVRHAEDRNSLAAALRETREEIGLDLERCGRLVARLSDIPSVAHRGQRRPLIVSPYVFIVDELPPLVLNHEVAAVLWVPLQFLADPANRGSIAWRRLKLAAYTYQNCQIWGLSLQMIDEMLQHLGVTPMAPGALRQSI